jgi:hypothetical protein
MENCEYFCVHETLKPILPETSKTLICSPLFGCCTWPFVAVFELREFTFLEIERRKRERVREREGGREKRK